jgi:hydroxymethylglutaryl-CoA lyase
MLPVPPPRVRVVEVGPRDGLQNERVAVPTADKIAFVNSLADAGFQAIELTAFVSPRWVPQMSDAAAVVAGVTARPSLEYSALVPNRAGLDRAMAAGVRHIAIVAAASETFSRRNLNASIDEALTTYGEVAAAALASGVTVRAYLSTGFGCPFEGAVPPERVVALSERLLALGAHEVAVSDTIGVAHPGQVARLLDRLLPTVAVEHLALHFHDTRGTALANVLAALHHGVTTFDSSAGGLGGCPFAPGAAGNLPTEDLLYMLDGLGIETGVSLDGVLQASLGIEAAIGHSLPSRYVQAWKTTRVKS